MQRYFKKREILTRRMQRPQYTLPSSGKRNKKKKITTEILQHSTSHSLCQVFASCKAGKIPDFVPSTTSTLFRYRVSTSFLREISLLRATILCNLPPSPILPLVGTRRERFSPDQATSLLFVDRFFLVLRIIYSQWRACLPCLSTQISLHPSHTQVFFLSFFFLPPFDHSALNFFLSLSQTRKISLFFLYRPLSSGAQSPCP